MRPPAVLIIDDEPLIRLSMEDALRAVGCEVRAAATGPEGLALLEQIPFDIVITDLRLPGADGLTLLQAAKQRSSRTEVVVITAHGSVETAVGAMKAGANGGSWRLAVPARSRINSACPPDAGPTNWMTLKLARRSCRSPTESSSHLARLCYNIHHYDGRCVSRRPSPRRSAGRAGRRSDRPSPTWPCVATSARRTPAGRLG